MTIDISLPDVGPNLSPQITVLGVGGSGGNAVNNMMTSNLEGVDFLVANTDAQALKYSTCKNKIQLGSKSTKGLGAGMRPDIGKQAAEEAIHEINEKLEGSHMVFIAAGMGGGTGTGAAPVIAKLAREKGILTVGVVTKPFHFEGTQRMKLADKGIEELQQHVDTLLTIPNQNLFKIANEKTTFADAFKMADDVLYAGVRGVTDLMVQPGLINLDFSDVKNVMSEMGKAMMGTGQASGEGRAIKAAEAAIANPLIDDVSLKGARGLIINITGGNDLTLYEVDEAANRIKQEVDDSANIIYGTTCDERLDDVVRISIVATGIDASSNINLQNNSFNETPSLSIDNSVYKKQVNGDDISIENSSNDHVSINKEHETIEDPANHYNDKIAEENSEEIIEENTMHNTNYEEESPANIEENNTHAFDLEANKIIEDDNANFQNNLDSISEENELNSVSKNEDEGEKAESSVRRLSLFDTLEDESRLKEENKNDDLNHKSEPVLEENNIQFDMDSNEDLENTGKPEVDEEFNQDKENDEDLLDIPTFLRRQAN
tara:strand:+ start:1447 stop:3087 length:1641 start_codon:yes stop_codon:yes gene_type:complete